MKPITPCYLVTGIAGSGKTRLFQHVIAERPNFGVLCATTGVAAVNLGAVTIHSFMGYSDMDDMRRTLKYGGFMNKLRRLVDEGELWPGCIVVIDEVSMLNAEQLDMTFQAFESLNNWLMRTRAEDDYVTCGACNGSGEEETEFGPKACGRCGGNGDVASDYTPIGLALVGDFCQLPPVDGEFAFKAAAWPNFADNRINLSGSYRQNSGAFVDALNLARRGAGQDCVALLQELGVEFEAMNDMEFDGVSVYGLNRDVDWYNQWRYSKLDSEEFVCKAVREGQQKKEWLKREMIPDSLSLKVGARVMVTANETEGFTYANGDMGEIVAVASRSNDGVVDSVAVVLDRNQLTVEVRKVERDWIDPKYHGPRWKAKEDHAVLGSVIYMPLKLGYALTVHKTQGLSLNRVQYNISATFTGFPAMSYTALSRARTPEGLCIIGTPQLLASRINAHKEVSPWL